MNVYHGSDTLDGVTYKKWDVNDSGYLMYLLTLSENPNEGEDGKITINVSKDSFLEYDNSVDASKYYNTTTDYILGLTDNPEKT